MSFDMTFQYSTTSSTCNTLLWIFVSHHPDHAIIVSTGFPPETDLDDKFIQPPTEQVLQLISNIKSTRCTRSMPAICQRCKLHRKTPGYTRSAHLIAQL